MHHRQPARTPTAEGDLDVKPPRVHRKDVCLVQYQLAAAPRLLLRIVKLHGHALELVGVVHVDVILESRVEAHPNKPAAQQLLPLCLLVADLGGGGHGLDAVDKVDEALVLIGRAQDPQPQAEALPDLRGGRNGGEGPQGGARRGRGGGALRGGGEAEGGEGQRCGQAAQGGHQRHEHGGPAGVHHAQSSCGAGALADVEMRSAHPGPDLRLP
mmetsp:Transcript_44040/g.107597  ORF Transcript_44040/g.107597 Transcript_44040/m.107597 type:complete len:213 (+) Transcript_44040:508-1146(+)